MANAKEGAAANPPKPPGAAEAEPEPARAGWLGIGRSVSWLAGAAASAAQTAATTASAAATSAAGALGMDLDGVATAEVAVLERENHVAAPVVTEEFAALGEELKGLITALPDMAAAPEAVRTRLLAPAALQRMLRARKHNVQKALVLAKQVMAWALKVRPGLIAPDSVEDEARTGKVRVVGRDVHGRPVVVLDNTCENTKDMEAQMRFLTFNLERSARMMEEGTTGVEKHVVFIHLNRFALLNAPPISTTRRTLELVSVFYAERLGHCILWQPPAYFKVFFSAIKLFIDAKTLKKAVLVRGSYEPGSANAEAMLALLGPDWKALTGVDGPMAGPGSSPGYVHESYWAKVKEDFAATSSTCSSSAAASSSG